LISLFPWDQVSTALSWSFWSDEFEMKPTPPNAHVAALSRD